MHTPSLQEWELACRDSSARSVYRRTQSAIVREDRAYGLIALSLTVLSLAILGQVT